MLITFIFILPLILLMFIIEKRIKEESGRVKTRAEMLGDIGESRVSNFLKIHYNKGFLINNVLLKNDKYTSQIDHVFITFNRDIYIIETKNRSGLIKGKLNEKNWVSFVGKKKYLLYNPIKQNEKHLRVIDKLLKSNNIENYNLKNIVVFTKDNSKIVINEENDIVYNLKDFENLIEKIYIKGEKDNIDDIIYVIQSNNLSDNREVLEKHINMVEEIALKNKK